MSYRRGRGPFPTPFCWGKSYTAVRTAHEAIRQAYKSYSRRYSLMSSDPSVRLRNAIIEDNYFITSRLLKRFPSLIDNIDPSNGWSNLHYSAYHNHYQIKELLLKEIHRRFMHSLSGSSEKGALHSGKPVYTTQITDEDEIKMSFKKRTVLHVACSGDAAATLILLLSYFNVCLDQRDDNGYTPSHICCIKGYPKCLAILLEHNAYPNIQDKDGDTPLHKAFQFSHMDCIELLISHNADDQLYNNMGWKPTDVAFDSQLMEGYKILKSNPTARGNIDDSPDLKMPQTKYAPGKTPQNNVSNVSFLTSGHNNNVPLEFQSRIKLPSIQPRKYSLSSMLSDEYADQLDTFDVDMLPATRSRSTSSSSKNSRGSSPSTNTHKFTLRKVPPGYLPDNTPASTRRYPQPPPPIPSTNFSSGPNSTLTSPRRTTIGSNSAQNESPSSKRSSLSTRTFRSNSLLSEASPVKSEYPSQALQGSIDPYTPRPSLSTPRQSYQTNKTNNTYPLQLQVDEASSKLYDFKLKNVDRLKLDTKLGNIINNTSQENLVASPTSIHHAGTAASLSEMGNGIPDAGKRSKILSIPILSSRNKHNP